MMIDMNQEGYFEEALKLRNLLREFEPPPDDDEAAAAGGGRASAAARKPGPVTVVGFKEHIFTQSSGFVTAIYMALQERCPASTLTAGWRRERPSFVCASSRLTRFVTSVLANPCFCR